MGKVAKRSKTNKQRKTTAADKPNKQRAAAVKALRKAFRQNTGPAVPEKIVTALGEVDFSHKTITNSFRSTFLTCRRKAMYEYGLRLTQRGLIDYFWVGEQVHHEMELMYGTGKWSEAKFRQRLHKEERVAQTLCVDDLQRQKLARGAACVAGLVPAYVDAFYASDMERYEIISTESSLPAIPIGNTEWKYLGKRDMLVRERKTDNLILWENKTTAQIDAAYVGRLPLDFQILGYVWGTQIELGETVDGILYNAVQKSQLRGKQGEPSNLLAKRIEQDYRNEPSKYFYREQIKFTQDAIAGFERELLRFVEELEYCLRTNNWTMNTNACTSRGYCQFMPLCIEGPDATNIVRYRRKTSVHEELANIEE